MLIGCDFSQIFKARDVLTNISRVEICSTGLPTKTNLPPLCYHYSYSHFSTRTPARLLKIDSNDLVFLLLLCLMWIGVDRSLDLTVPSCHPVSISISSPTLIQRLRQTRRESTLSTMMTELILYFVSTPYDYTVIIHQLYTSDYSSILTIFLS